MFAVTLLLLCAIFAVAFGVTHRMVTYDLSDSARNDRYPAGKKEHHCFQEELVNGVAEKQFVRGSYGMFGYFEGFSDKNPVNPEGNPNLFHVNFWEGSNHDGEAISGAATIMYNVYSVQGAFWNTGSNNLENSVGKWYSTLPMGQNNPGCVFSPTQACPDGADFLKQCLYDPASPDRHAFYHESGFHKGNVYSKPTVQPKPPTSGTASPDVVSQISLKQLYGNSSWLGAYTLESTIPPAPDAGQGAQPVHVEERGHYGRAQAFRTDTGAGVYGSWNAVSPEEASGSMLYKFTEHGGKPKLVGWWCESEESEVPSPNSGNPPMNVTETFRTNCYHEEDHLVKKKNDLCPKIFAEDENDPLRRLANVANRGVNRD